MWLTLFTLLMYSICCLVWGSTWAVIRVGLNELPPLAFAASRMTLVAILVLPIVWRHRRNLLPGQLTQLYAIGALQFGLSFACIFAAETRVDSGLTAVLFGTYPLFALAVARVYLPDERFARTHIIAIVLGFIGLAVMHLAPGEQALNIALAFPIIAAAVSAIASVATKRIASKLPPLLTLGLNAQSGAALLWLLHLVFERDQTWHYTTRGMLMIAYLAVFGSIVAFGCLLWLLPRISIALIGFMTFVEALFGVIVGMVFLGEQPEPRVLAGAAAVLASIGIAIIPARR